MFWYVRHNILTKAFNFWIRNIVTNYLDILLIAEIHCKQNSTVIQIKRTTIKNVGPMRNWRDLTLLSGKTYHVLYDYIEIAVLFEFRTKNHKLWSNNHQKSIQLLKAIHNCNKIFKVNQLQISQSSAHCHRTWVSHFSSIH